MTLVEAARSYLGVRFRHRGRSRKGLDCAGLVVLAYRDCGVETSDYVLYGREPHLNGLTERLTAALGDPLPTRSAMQEGDVVEMRFDVYPHHVGIVAAVNYGGVSAFNLIHADGHSSRVLEQRLTPDMMARITHVFRRAL